MLTLAICDDDKTELGKITEIIKEWTLKHDEEEISIKTFSSPYTLLDTVMCGESYDIFLLDILMPEMTGISLGEQLQSLCSDPLIIFLTSSEDFYPDAFRLYAFQYICKPFRKSTLFETMDRAILRCERRKSNMFAVKTAEGIVQLPIHTIVYVELSAHICHVHLADGRALQSRYLRTGFDTFIGPLLVQDNFVKTHTAFVVNLNFAGRLAQNKLMLTTGGYVPVSRTFADEVQHRYMEYALRDEGGFR